MTQVEHPDLVIIPGPEPASERSDLTFVGTATVIIRFGGFTILTDPNFLHQGDHAPLGYGLTATRLTDPAIEWHDLPPIDFVLLSHHHGDHFDPFVVDHLAKDTPIVTEPHSARKLRRQGFRRPIGLQTWEHLTVRRGDAWVTITALPAKHAPQPLRTLLPKVMGSMLEFGAGTQARQLRLYVTGDTLMHAGLQEIRDRYPQVDVCVIHLGGTRIAGVMLTMDARQGVQVLKLIQPRTAIPVHFDDYDVFASPLDDFRRLVEESGLDAMVHYLDRGETFQFGV